MRESPPRRIRCASIQETRTIFAAGAGPGDGSQPGPIEPRNYDLPQTLPVSLLGATRAQTPQDRLRGREHTPKHSNKEFRPGIDPRLEDEQSWRCARSGVPGW